MSDATEERIVKNNLTFREANEHIRARAEKHEAPLERIPFLCECPQPRCVEIVRLTLPEYSEIRANPQTFFTALGHETFDEPVGRVVDRKESHVVVEKIHAVLDG